MRFIIVNYWISFESKRVTLVSSFLFAGERDNSKNLVRRGCTRTASIHYFFIYIHIYEPSCLSRTHVFTLALLHLRGNSAVKHFV